MEQVATDGCDVSTVGPSSRRSSISSVNSSRSSVSVAGSTHSESSVDARAGESGKFRVTHSALLVTWSQSRIEDEKEFHRQLVELMPTGTEIYGCRERHEDGHPHYHVVLRFEKRQNWRNARPHFYMRLPNGEVDTTAIRISLPETFQRQSAFLENTQNYCEKVEDSAMFGQRIALPAETLKRKYEEVLEETDFHEAKRKLMRIDPVGFVKHYPALMQFLNGEKLRNEASWVSELEDPLPWNVPPVLEEWKQKYVDVRCKGRPIPLILIGGSRLGKTEWAASAGARPIVMSKTWNVKKYIREGTHVVLNDVDFRTFGSGVNRYWRELLGCQLQFDAHDRYTSTRNLDWGFPLIVTCNYDNDPRKIPEVAEYLAHAPCVVVEITEPLFKVEE
jgi:hypothetical protein